MYVFDDIVYCATLHNSLSPGDASDGSKCLGSPYDRYLLQFALVPWNESMNFPLSGMYSYM